MYEVVGPQLLLDYTDVFGVTYTESIAAADADGSDDADGASTGSRPKVCLHEDGGKFAVFEEILVSDPVRHSSRTPFLAYPVGCG